MSQESLQQSETVLDARRLLCPIPVIRTQERVKKMASGQTLTIVATDPGVQQDIPAWCRINGHAVLESAQVDFEFHITIKVGE